MRKARALPELMKDRAIDDLLMDKVAHFQTLLGFS